MVIVVASEVRNKFRYKEEGLLKWIEVDLGDIDYAYIIPISDLHIGDKYFDEKKFLKIRDFIANETNTYVILCGDILNCATKNSVSDIYSEIKNPQEAKKYAYELLQPISNKIIGLTSGNHEYRIWKESGNDIAEDLAVLLGCEYGREGLLLCVRLGRNKLKNKLAYTLYATHGYGGGRTVGAKANALKRVSEIVFADIYIIGHIHHMQSFADYYYIPDVIHKKIERRKRLYVSSSSFLEWGGYAEQGLFPPSKTGCPRIRLAGDRKDFHVSI